MVASPQRAREELLFERLSAGDYADREGYDCRFLGVNVPFQTWKVTPDLAVYCACHRRRGQRSL